MHKEIIATCLMFATSIAFANLEPVTAGGFGGNEKVGRFFYDGHKLPNHFPKFDLLRDAESRICYLQNYQVIVRVVDSKNNDPIVQFACDNVDSDKQIYWDANLEALNGAYSPANDAFTAGEVVSNMYQDWYNLLVLKTDDNQPMQIQLRLHDWGGTLAYWDGKSVSFGDGDATNYYPFVSLGVAAHEISHGFTQQHAGLIYEGQSGGLNESFSDIASKAAEFYASGAIKNWELGAEVVRANHAFRYMDNPRRDCVDNLQKVYCSIDNLKDYSTALDVHLTSGIYNKFFYLLATSENWDVQKAFNVMVQANRAYWTSTVTFTDAACGVLEATKDYGYETTAVVNAFKQVGIVTNC